MTDNFLGVFDFFDKDIFCLYIGFVEVIGRTLFLFNVLLNLG